MWVTVGILFLGAVVSIFEVRPFIKRKNYREMFIYSFLLLSGLTLSSLLAFKMRIPTPLDLLKQFYKPLVSLIERLLS